MGKRAAAAALALLMLANVLIVALPDRGIGAKAYAAGGTSYGETALFEDYPGYLYCKEDARQVNAVLQPGYDLIYSRTTGQEVLAALKSVILEGKAISVVSGMLGLSRSEFDKLNEEAAMELVFELMGNEDFIEAYFDLYGPSMQLVGEEVNKEISRIKGQKVGADRKKAALDTLTLYSNCIDGVSLAIDDFNYGGEVLTNYTAAIKKSINEIKTNNAKLDEMSLCFTAASTLDNMIATFHAAAMLDNVESFALEYLKDSLDTDSDLYNGLVLLENDIAKKGGYIGNRLLENLSGAAVSVMISFATYTLPTVGLMLNVLNFTMNVVYRGPTTEALMLSRMHASNIVHLDGRVTALQKELVSLSEEGASKEDMQRGALEYKVAYCAYVCAIPLFLEYCAQLATSSEQYIATSLRDHAKQIRNGSLISYDIHIERCIDALNEAAEAGKISGLFGKLPEDMAGLTIEERLQKIMEQYVPNANVEFDTGTIGGEYFASTIFRLLFGADKSISGRTKPGKDYSLSCESDLYVVGLIDNTDDSMTEAKLSALLKKAKCGDILLSGSHWAIVVSTDSYGVTLYDVRSPFYDRDSIIRSYPKAYSELFEKYQNYSGVGLYRAVGRDSAGEGGNGIEYDDSPNFVVKDGVLTAYYGWQKNIVIPGTVKKIDEKVFRNKTFIYSVTIPAGVTSIGAEAFSGCTNLGSLSIGSGLKTIGESAFAGCKSLGRVQLPSSVTSIGASAFMNCSVLSSINIPSGVTIIRNNTFSGCSRLSTTLHTGITSIGDNAFNGCGGITSVTLGDDFTTLGDRAFANCTSLSEVNLGYGITTIGSEVFSGDSFLKRIELPPSLTSYPGRNGEKGALCGSYIESVLISGWNVIELPAFICYQAKHLKYVTMPASTQKIGGYDFAECTSLTEVDLPNNLGYIDTAAFDGCTSLTYIDLPDSCYFLCSFIFRDCTSLSRVFLGNKLEGSGSAVFKNTPKLKSIRIPATYQNAPKDPEKDVASMLYGSSIENVEIAYGMRDIPENMFGEAGQLRTVTIPETVRSIGPKAFRDCTQLGKLTLLDNVTTIDEQAFPNCYSLSIEGYTETPAETYANAHSIPFIPLERPATPPEDEGGTGGEEPEEPFFPELCETNEFIIDCSNISELEMTLKSLSEEDERTLTTSTGGICVKAGFIIAKIPEDCKGDFEFTVRKPGCTSYIDKCLTVPEEIPESITLYTGDLNADGEINAHDHAAMGELFGLNSVEWGYDISADFNRDGFINAKDRADIVTHFGRTSTVLD